ncbi:MAG TPA: response regulator transcription factor [Azospirillaceae bacterium]|nr:response regulator transcription factor [Azospirillaceae bacterium]
MASINVMLVDHDQLFGAALGALLEEDRFDVGRPFASVDEAVRAIEAGAAPDLLVVDPAPGAHASEEAEGKLRRLQEKAEPARLVVLTADDGAEAVRASLRAGADGHLSKSASFEAVRRSLHLVMAGGSVYPAAAVDLSGRGEEVADVALPEGAAGELSRREVQILACLLAGESNKSIARRLDITESTVKMHFKNVMRKIQAQNRTQAAVWALQRGIAPMA